jgi:PDZ domain-containing secreted protein
MEWEGEGEMPEEMAKEMKNVKIKKIKDGDNMTITIDAEGDEENGKVIVMEEAGKGKKKNKMMFIEDTDKVFFNEKGRKLRMEKGNDNKATLGVNIDDTEDGVLITDIVEGSAAAKADLRRDDVILKINDKYIFTSDGLLKALRPFNPGETIKVRYIRDGKEKSVKAKLSGR